MNSLLQKKYLDKKELDFLDSVLRFCQTSIRCVDCGIFVFDPEKEKLTPFSVLKDVSVLKDKIEENVDQKILKRLSRTNSEKRLEIVKDLGVVPLFIKDDFLGIFICLLGESEKKSIKDSADSILISADILLSLFEKFYQSESLKMLELFSRNSLNQINKLNRSETVLELADIIAHDINNPLQIILGKAQVLLLKKEFDKNYLERELKTIEESADRISSLAKELSFYVKQARGQAVPVGDLGDVDVDIGKILEHACSLLKDRFKSKGVDLELKVEKDLPKVRGGPHRLECVFLNLLLNAKDSMIQKGRLKVRAKKHRRCVQLDFSDTGERIPLDVLPKVFDPFLVAPGLNRKLGSDLFFASQVVEEHRGTIQAKVNQDVNTFTIRLPIKEGGA